jgi:Zn finger protein HypA/HybF involved in hydrogenase expression
MLALFGSLLLAGCGDDGSKIAVDAAVKTKEEGKLFRCRMCRKTVENKQIRRVSQTRGTCPECGKTGPMIPVR